MNFRPRRQAALQADVPLRIFIGVTGHRALPHPEKTAAAAAELLRRRIGELFDAPFDRGQIPPRIVFTVISSLAEGADRLVAEEVLRLDHAALEAVLPFAPEDYRQDFSGGESQRQFDDLCARAERLTVLKKNKPAEEKTPDGRVEARLAAYEDAGRRVVRQCDFLIAVWDGKPARGRGGTAEIVEYALKRRCPLVIISSEDAAEIQIIKGRGLSSRLFRRIDAFNRFPVPVKVQEAYAQALDIQLFRNSEGEKIGAEVKGLIREKLLPFYIRASRMAKFNQKRYLRAGLLVFILSPLAVAAVMIGILIHSLSIAAFAFEMILLGGIFSVIFYADRRKVHRKWIESRFLTERLRSAIFLAACGLRPSGVDLPAHMKTTHQVEEWTLRVFDDIMRKADGLKGCNPENVPACAAFIRKHWIQKQIDFHAGKALKAGRTSRRLEIAGQAAFLAAMVAAAVHLAFFIAGPAPALAGIEKPLLFLAVVLPALGAAVGGIRSHREYSRLRTRSDNMASALDLIKERLQSAVSPSELEAVLRDAENLMLQEMQDWLFLMKFIRVEPA